MSLQRPLLQGLANSGGSDESRTGASNRSSSENNSVRSAPPTTQRSHSVEAETEEEGQQKTPKKRKERVTWAGMVRDSSSRVGHRESSRSSHRQLSRSGHRSTKTRRLHPLSLDIQEEEAEVIYSLYEDDGGEEGREDRSPSFAGSSFMSGDQELTGNVIDGRISVPGDFVSVEPRSQALPNVDCKRRKAGRWPGNETTFFVDLIPSGIDTMSTTHNLEICKRTVLNPYLYFLKLIGWRRIGVSRHDLRVPWWVVVANIVYPTLIFLIHVAVCATQAVTCFFRDKPINPSPDNNDDLLVIACGDHFVTRWVVPDVMLLSTYLYGLYIFRFAEPEHLTTLMETVFLTYMSRHVGKHQGRLIFTLRLFLFGMLVWVVFSFFLSIMRVFSLQLLDDNTYIEWISIQNLSDPTITDHTHKEDALRYALVIFSTLGFICFDLLYAAVVINYASQTQLLLFYICSIMDKVRTKAYHLGDAVKDMRHAYEFLQVMNGKLATLTSLVLFIFISGLATSLYGLLEFRSSYDSQVLLYLGVIVGVCNIIQWAFLTSIPIVQASRLTSTCRRLRRLGLEIAARPFSYSHTPQLVLDSFLQYTNATRYTAKLAAVPIYPSLVIGVLFVVGLIVIFYISTYPTFEFAPWV